MSDQESKKSGEIEQIKNNTGVNYSVDEDIVSYTQGKNDTQHFIDFIVYLVDNSYITKDDIPYTPGYGKIRYLLNETSVHQDGREMTRPVEVIEGVYLETNHDSESKKRYTKQIIQDFVLD